MAKHFLKTILDFLSLRIYPIYLFLQNHEERASIFSPTELLANHALTVRQKRLVSAKNIRLAESTVRHDSVRERVRFAKKSMRVLYSE